MEANISKVLDNATITQDIFKILLLNIKNDTGDHLEQIGFKSFYKDGDMEYLLDVFGDQDMNYKMQVEEIGCGIVDPVKIDLTPFQYKVLETVFDIEVKKVLNANFRRVL